MASELLASGYEYLLIDDGWPEFTAHAHRAGPTRDANDNPISQYFDLAAAGCSASDPATGVEACCKVCTTCLYRPVDFVL